MADAHHHGDHEPGHHHGWAPAGPRRRWLEPFVLVLLADRRVHGYSLLTRLNGLGVAPAALDVGQLYRTLRELEHAGLVRSSWTATASGPYRREYVITPEGWTALQGWAAVMRERVRLVDVFFQEYERARGRVEEV